MKATDSLHKIWKFKSFKSLVPGMFSLPDIHFLDLRTIDSLSYLNAKGVQADIPLAYKIIDNTIVIQTEGEDNLEDKDNLVKVKFKISELTSSTLKLIVIRSDERNIDNGIIELVFETVVK